MAKKIHKIKGVTLSSASSNTRYGKRDDSLAIAIPSESMLSGKFTTNKLKAAPVILAAQNLQKLSSGNKILLVNAGNANAANCLLYTSPSPRDT